MTAPFDAFVYGFGLGTFALLRIGYGLLNLAQIASFVPHARRFFGTAASGGYRDDERRAWLHRPLGIAVLLAVWAAASAALLAGVALLPAALVAAAIARYLFVYDRRSGLFNGAGALGKVNAWLAGALAALALAQALDPTGRTVTIVATAARIDFGLIIATAGLYKAITGYPRGQGVQFGVMHPWYGGFARLARRLRGDHPLYLALNHAAWIGETAIGVGLLVPATAPAAALCLAIGFLLIGIGMRLSLLAEMVIVVALLYVPAGSVLDVVGARLAVPIAPLGALAPFAPMLAWCAIVYAVLAPFTYALIYAAYLRRSGYPRWLQLAIERWQWLTDIGLWRVVTIDYITLHIDIYALERDGTRILLSPPPPRWQGPFARFAHVGEFSALYAIFNGLRFTHDQVRFEERLVRYARTLADRAAGRPLVFVARETTIEGGLAAVHDLNEFTVDLVSGTVGERRIDPRRDCRDAPVGTRIYARPRALLEAPR